MNYENISYGIILSIVGLPIVILGILIWKKEMISLIHKYHYANVSPENKKSYTRAMGIALSLLGAALVLNGIISIFVSIILEKTVLLVSMVAFIVAFIIIQYKYNGSIMSFKYYKNNSEENMEIETTKLHIIVNALSILILAISVITVIILFPNMPDKIPAHFNGLGEVDEYGSKSSIFIFIIAYIVVLLPIIITQNYPKLWNTGFSVKPENHKKSLAETKNMLVFLSLSISILFSFLLINTALCRPLGAFSMPIMLAIIFAPIIIFTIRVFKLR